MVVELRSFGNQSFIVRFCSCAGRVRSHLWSGWRSAWLRWLLHVQWTRLPPRSHTTAHTPTSSYRRHRHPGRPGLPRRSSLRPGSSRPPGGEHGPPWPCRRSRPRSCLRRRPPGPPSARWSLRPRQDARPDHPRSRCLDRQICSPLSATRTSKCDL